MKLPSLLLAVGLLAMACQTGPGGNPDGGDGGALFCNRTTEPQVTIDIPIGSSCAALTACGGSPAGVWHYASVCMDNPFAPVAQACPSFTTTAASGTAQGCVDFSLGSSGEVYRDLNWSVSGTIHLPASCVPGSCAQAQTALATYVPGATCSNATAGGCDCSVSASGTALGSTDFTVAGNSLDVTNDTRTFDLCVSPGTSLSYRETTSSNPEPGNWTLAPN
jgi:hypothetical protein